MCVWEEVFKATNVDTSISECFQALESGLVADVRPHVIPKGEMKGKIMELEKIKLSGIRQTQEGTQHIVFRDNLTCSIFNMYYLYIINIWHESRKGNHWERRG